MYKYTNYCRLCLNKKIKIGIKLKKMPLGEKYSNKKSFINNFYKFPLSIGWCNNCKNIQTMEVVSPKLLWGDFTYLSSQTKAITDHFKVLSKQIIKRFKLTKSDMVLDIGSNDGSFLKFFKNKKIKVLGVDPASNVAKIAKKNGIETLVNFFGLKIAKKIKKKYKKAKIIICFNTFAHAENMREIIKSINEILDQNGIFIFECQYLNDIYKKKILGTIFHEHMYHHSVTSLNNLFNSFNLDLFDAQRVNIQKGSIIGFVCKKNERKISKNVKKFLKMEKDNGDTSFKKLKNFSNFISLQRNRSDKIMSKYKNKFVGAFGSARSGPTLAINYNVSKYLSIIFDDHPLKVGKYSAFKGLKVHPTKEISTLKPAVLIVLAYLHLKKIIKKNKKYLIKNGKFLSLYPKVELISLKNYKKFI